MTNVTKTYLPPLKKYSQYLSKIWKGDWITNNGPFVIELEKRLKEYLGVKHLFFVTNGTIALQIAIKSLGLEKEVITTPFSYIATTSSLVWERCQPVFADIDPQTLTINPNEIENKITKKTTGILATHVYGNPCNVEEIKKIAKKNGLKVIYDAAHSFGVKYNGESILKYGDVSILSFHATKIFHTVEGGAIVTNDDTVAQKIFYMRNFGHADKEKPESFLGLGINAKSSELHAAMGLCVLPQVKQLINKKRSLSLFYTKAFENTSLVRPSIRDGTEYNYSYYPIIFPDEKSLLRTVAALNENNIFPRRYFFPSLNTLGYVRGSRMPISEDISRRILCLPLAYNLTKKEIAKITSIIKKII